MSANKPPPKGNKWWPHVTHYCVTTFITVKPALPLLTQFTHSCAYYTYYMCVLHIHVDHVLVLTCACLCACLVPFPLCPHKLKEIIICLFVFFSQSKVGNHSFFLNHIFHLSAMFTLIRDHSPVFISHCQKGLLVISDCRQFEL